MLLGFCWKNTNSDTGDFSQTWIAKAQKHHSKIELAGG